MVTDGKERVYTVIARLPCRRVVISKVVGVGMDPIKDFMNKGPFWTEAYYAYEKDDGSGVFNGVVYNDSLIRAANTQVDAILDLLDPSKR